MNSNNIKVIYHMVFNRLTALLILIIWCFIFNNSSTIHTFIDVLSLFTACSILIYRGFWFNYVITRRYCCTLLFEIRVLTTLLIYIFWLFSFHYIYTIFNNWSRTLIFKLWIITTLFILFIRSFICNYCFTIHTLINKLSLFTTRIILIFWWFIIYYC